MGVIRIELSVEDDALGSGVNFTTEDIVKEWSNQDENDDQQDIVNAFVDELSEDIATMALDQS